MERINQRGPLKPKPPAPKLRNSETRVRLTEDERHTLNRICGMAGVPMSDVLRSTIMLFRPYLNIQGAMDKKYELTLANALRNPNAITIQLLEDERSDIYRNESDCLNGYRDTRVIRDAEDTDTPDNIHVKSRDCASPDHHAQDYDDYWGV